MSDEVFDRAVAIVLEREGLHNVDAGGDTVFGIARRFHLAETPWPPSRGRAIEIYRDEYWTRRRCGDLPPILAIALFDAVVNQGEAVENLQRALHVEPDGQIGPATVAAANRSDPWETVALFYARRAQRYVEKSRPSDQIGLLARLFRTQRDLIRSYPEVGA